MSQIDELCAILGVAFANPSLLHAALTHRSFVCEYPEQTAWHISNERLEFLGDSILNFLAASWLYQQFPGYSEGELSRFRSALVRKTTLARFARELNLGPHIRMSHSEMKRDGRERDRLLSDAFEALLAALYLDQGIEAVESFVVPFLEREASRVLAGEAEGDYRTQLQKLLQSHAGITPTYRTIGMSGPPHARTFTVEVLRGNERLGIGTGSSKQTAAQEAARVALQRMNEPCTVF